MEVLAWTGGSSTGAELAPGGETGAFFFRILTSGSLDSLRSGFISKCPDSSPGGAGHSSVQILFLFLRQSANRKERPAVTRKRDIREIARGPRGLGEGSIS